jgi:C1A family cysteine protease
MSGLIILSLILVTGNGRLKLAYAQYTTKEDILKQFDQDKQNITRNQDEIKSLMNGILSDIRSKNLKFRVEINEMMQYLISQITGNMPPSQDEIKRKEDERRKKEEADRQIEEKRKQDEQKRLDAERKKRDDEIARENDLKKQQDLKRQEDERRKQEDIQRQNAENMKVMADRNVPLAIAPAVTLAAFNWRDSRKTTDVKYQGLCGSCWTFTSAAIYETNYLIKNGSVLNVSEQAILDCAKDRSGNDAGSEL